MKLATWWKTWSALIGRLFALAASLASLLGLLIPFLPAPVKLPGWAVALLVSAAFFFIVLVVLEFHAHRGRRVYATTDSEGIKRYMHNWIEHGGRVAIWTRDMSWAQNAETKKLLNTKAAQKELILCLPEVNDLARELQEAGAEVLAYGAERLESPASRFTIAFFGRDGSRVAVGRAEGDTHVIDEFEAHGHPAFHLASDLVAFARGNRADRRPR
jgi:hypothetical protein